MPKDKNMALEIEAFGAGDQIQGKVEGSEAVAKRILDRSKIDW